MEYLPVNWLTNSPLSHLYGKTEANSMKALLLGRDRAASSVLYTAPRRPHRADGFRYKAGSLGSHSCWPLLLFSPNFLIGFLCRDDWLRLLFISRGLFFPIAGRLEGCRHCCQLFLGLDGLG